MNNDQPQSEVTDAVANVEAKQVTDNLNEATTQDGSYDTSNTDIDNDSPFIDESLRSDQ